MKKIKILSIIAALVFGLGFSNPNSNADIAEASGSVAYLSDGEFYASVTGMKSTTLLNELADIMYEQHNKYTSYEQIKDITQYTDTDPNNSDNVILFYKGTSVQGPWSSGGEFWNREHVWPQNLSGGLYGESGAGADIHHIRPTDKNVNSSRSNRKYTELPDNAQESDLAPGNYLATDVWEPRAEVKGDAARIIMYLYTHYSTKVSNNNNRAPKGAYEAGALDFDNVISISNTSYNSAKELLLDWNKIDPVDEFEMNRNLACASYTGVRNPFIDHPEFATMIWDSSYSGAGALLDDGSGSGGSGSGSTTVEVTSVTVSPTSASLNVGETKQLSATINPSTATNKTVTWTSSSSIIATVDSNGLVTAKGEGTATITAKSSNNKTATCVVTVSNTSGGDSSDDLSGDTYEKVTSTPSSWEGNYLIVYEEGNVAFDGSLENLDAASNTIEVSITNNSIVANDETKASSFTIDSNGYIKSQSGFYIGQTQNDNGLVSNESTAYTNTLSVNNDGTVNIVSGEAYLRFNAASNQNRFRYYKSSSYTGQKAICLYKLNKTTSTSTSVTGVSLDTTSKSLYIGDSFTLTPTISPDNATNKSVTWSSSKESVATVDNGTVTAVGEGTTTITVTTADGGKTAKCEVIVNPIKVTGVSLDKLTLSLNVGETSTLNANVTPTDATNKNVTWTTTNSSIATVSNGVVTAVGVGSATIKVTTVDGSKTASCEVTVSPIKVTSVTLSSETLSLVKGDQETLTAEVLPLTATNKELVWTSSKEDVATVNNGVITAVGVGETTIKASATDGSNIYDTCVVTVTEVESGGNTVVEQTATITFDDKAKRTSYSTTQQVWEENNITVTNNKGSGNNISDYSNPARFYKNSELIIEYISEMTKIEVTANTSEYASSLQKSIGDGATVSGSIVTIVFTNPKPSFTCTLSDGQARLDSITVYYETTTSGGGTTDPGPEVPTPDIQVIEQSNIYYQLVTNVSELVEGETYVIAAADYDYALSTNQKTNNRGQRAVAKETVVNSYLYETVDSSVTDNIQVITLEKGNKDGTFAFNVGESYLYAASSSSNYLKIEATLTDNSSWSITISDGIANVVAQGTNTNNILKYNQGNNLFSCYGASNTQKDISIYRVSDANKLINDWLEMRSESSNSFCDHINSKDAVITSLVQRYDALDNYGKAIVNNADDVTNEYGTCKINESIDFARTRLATLSSNESKSLNILLNTSSSSIGLILIVGILGLISIIGYYYLNKKKYN